MALLFQVAEGSANPDLTPEPVQWSYLSGNRWRTFTTAACIADGTRGLINSGIVELSLRPAEPSTLLPGGPVLDPRRHRPLRRQRVRHGRRPRERGARDVRRPRQRARSSERSRFPPGASPSRSTPIPGIAAIRQPYTSFGGKMAEQDASFYVEGERAPAPQAARADPLGLRAPGAGEIPADLQGQVPAADPAAHPRELGTCRRWWSSRTSRTGMPFDPFEPKAPADLIRDIESLPRRTRRRPFAARHRQERATTCPVKVRCGVRFLPGRTRASPEAAQRRAEPVPVAVGLRGGRRPGDRREHLRQQHHRLHRAARLRRLRRRDQAVHQRGRRPSRSTSLPRPTTTMRRRTRRGRRPGRGTRRISST